MFWFVEYRHTDMPRAPFHRTIPIFTPAWIMDRFSKKFSMYHLFMSTTHIDHTTTDVQALNSDKQLIMHVSDWNNSVGSNMRAYCPKYHQYRIKTKTSTGIDTSATPGALLDIITQYNYLQRGNQRVTSEEVCTFHIKKSCKISYFLRICMWWC